MPTTPWAGVCGRGDLLAWLREQPGLVALLVVDLRRLFTINARLGTGAGDHLIATTRRRLELSVGAEGLVAHLGQDDFAVAVAGRPEVGARALAERLAAELQRPVIWDGSVIEPQVSIGIATGVGAGEALMEAAVLAMRTGKRKQVTIEVGHASRLDQALGRNDLMYELARAIDTGEFELHLQPQVNLATGELDGVEALARWRHPLRGLLSPAAFIEPAESSGLILPLGSHLLDLATDLLRTWNPRHGRLWVNLSPMQLADGQRLLDDLARVTEACLDPSLLGLEITETGILSDLDGAIELLEQVRSAGFDLALDDFGTGYSSLSYLRRLPVTTLKIDRSFVTGVADVAADLAIVESVVGLAHSLDLRVVAEGIEDQIHAEAVRQLGVDIGQGYWFGRPQAATDFPDDHQPWCGRQMSPDGTRAFTQRAQLLYGALDALPCPALVTESIGGRIRISAVNQLLADQCMAAAGGLVGRNLEWFAASGVSDAELERWTQATHAATAGMVRLAPGGHGGGVWDVEVRPFASNAGRAERRLHLFHSAFGNEAIRGDRILGMVDGARDGIVVINDRLEVCWVDPAMCAMVGLGPDWYIGRPVADVLHPDDLERAVERVVSVLANKDFRRSRFRVLTGDGSYRWFEMVSRPDSPANPGGLVVNCHDIAEEVAAEEAASYLKSLDDVAAEVSRWALELGPGMFLGELSRVLGAVGGVFDVHITEVNTFEHGDLHLASTWVRPDQPISTGSDTWVWREAAARLANEVGEVLAYDDLDLTDEWWTPAFRSVDVPDRAMVFIPLRSRGTLVGSMHLGVIDGSRAWSDAELAVARRIAETIAHVIVRERLDAALTRSESELQHLANHDPLTGLANRTKMAREVGRMLAAAHPEGSAVILLDLDGFKPVNDTAGHEVGDLVLKEIAARLMRVGGPANLACRLGGDEFVVCVPASDLTEACSLAESLVEAVSSPIEDPFGSVWDLGASAGVAHGRTCDPEAMVRAADRAMYIAKRAGGRRVESIELE